MSGMVIVGASGRMGRALIEAVIETEEATLVGATVRPGSTLSGADAGELVGKGRMDAQVASSLDAFADRQPVVIDFTTIEATLQHLSWCVSHTVPCVIGTTGFSAQQETSVGHCLSPPGRISQFSRNDSAVREKSAPSFLVSSSSAETQSGSRIFPSL